MDGLTWVRVQWDRLAAWALIGGGAMFVVGASLQARNGIYAADQFSLLLSGGIGGLAAGGLGSTLLLAADFHDEWRKLDGIEAALRDGLVAGSPAPGRVNGVAGPATAVMPSRGTPGRWLRAELDRLGGGALVAVGLVTLLFGYRHLAASLYLPEQVASLIWSGLGALLCVFIGTAVFLFADLRDEEHKLNRIEQALDGSAPLDARGVLTLVAAGLAAPGASEGRNGQSEGRNGRSVGRWVLPVVAALAVGVGLIGFGWARAADATELDPALEGLVVAVVGLGLALAGLAVGALSLRSNVSRRIRHVMARIADAGQDDELLLETEGLWTARGLRRYHRGACPALAGALADRRAVAAGITELEPCLLCDAGD